MPLMESNQGNFVNYNFKDTPVEKPTTGKDPEECFSCTASSLMKTEIVSVKLETELNQAWSMMKEVKAHHLPVTNEEGLLIGVISDKDLARIGNQIQIFSVREIMSKRAIAATASTPLKEILHVMITEKINSVPIIEDSNKLVGIVTSTDILKHFYKWC